MFKIIKKLGILLLLILALSSPAAWASGKMEVGIGQTVRLMADSDLFAPTYKWVVKREGEILSTQTSRNFTFTFPIQGEYTINLTATTEETATQEAQIETTTLYVLAGDRYPRPYSPKVSPDETPSGEKLQLDLKTLPPLNAQNQVQLLGDGRLQFLVEGEGDVLEYRIDRNIFEDSDGNGIANDDIDNANDDSYLTGGAWLTTYQKEDIPRLAAEVTLVDKTGEKVKQQVDILFSSRNESNDLKAILQTLPEVNQEDNAIHLHQDPHLVSFYSRASTGNILEYRIDRNIFEDSDGDGDPANDIDNLNDISFKTGDVFEVNYTKTDQQIIAQLIVVGEGGKGSRVQVGIQFGDKPAPSILDPSSGQTEGIYLSADKTLVLKGDPISFEVKGLAQDLSQYIFQWDFDGDGAIDKETEGQNAIEHIYENPGTYTVKVIITDQQGNSARHESEIIVKDLVKTKADFTFSIDQNTVQFTSLSTADSRLANQDLNYQWSFGDTDPDNFEAQRDQTRVSNPTYRYAEPGTYIVTLTVTDTNGVTDSKTAEIEIISGDQEIPAGEEGDKEMPAETDPEGSLVMTILKFSLYLILILLGLTSLIITGFLIFLKVQYPDLTFEELIDEFKVKILTFIGAHEATPSESKENIDLPKPPTVEAAPPSPSEEQHSDLSGVNQQAEPSSDQALSDDQPVAENNKDAAPEPPLAAENGPMPAWLQNKQVIEGEVEEEPQPPLADEAALSPESPEQPAEEEINSETAPADDEENLNQDYTDLSSDEAGDDWPGETDHTENTGDNTFEDDYSEDEDIEFDDMDSEDWGDDSLDGSDDFDSGTDEFFDESSDEDDFSGGDSEMPEITEDAEDAEEAPTLNDEPDQAPAKTDQSADQPSQDDSGPVPDWLKEE